MLQRKTSRAPAANPGRARGSVIRLKRVNPEELEDAILLLTDSPHWHTIVKGLYNEVEATHFNALYKQSWEEVVEAKGFVKGLMYVITLREQLRAAKDNAVRL